MHPMVSSVDSAKLRFAPGTSGRLRSIGVAPAEISASIFRPYDIRGVVGETLDPGIVHEIARAIGSEGAERGQSTIVVGRDGRLSSPELAEALVDGLRATGRDVIDIGAVPTPVLYFATHFFGTDSGIMVTGSHNPSAYNGLKIMLAGETLSGAEITALRTRLQSGPLVAGAGAYRCEEVVDAYVQEVCRNIAVARNRTFRVAVDCGNGIAGRVAPELIRELGHEVVELYCDVDGRFPNHHPDPSEPRNLKALIERVRSGRTDLGFAFDGDGDRLGVVDGAGTIIWPDRQLMLFAADLLTRERGAEIVFDVKCSRHLGKLIASRGGVPVMWKTGHSFIKKKLRQSGAPLAGEMSGHIFFADRWYGFDDALYAAARMLEILAMDARPPVEVFAELPEGISTPELKVEMEEGRQYRFVEELARNAGALSGRFTDIDGVRVDYADGWGLVRASNTTPSLVLRFEGDSPEALTRIRNAFGHVLLDLDPELALPFSVEDREVSPVSSARPVDANAATTSASVKGVSPQFVVD